MENLFDAVAFFQVHTLNFFIILVSLCLLMIVILLVDIKQVLRCWREERKSENILPLPSDHPCLNVMIQMEQCVVRRRRLVLGACLGGRANETLAVYDLLGKEDEFGDLPTTDSGVGADLHPTDSTTDGTSTSTPSSRQLPTTIPTMADTLKG